MEMQWLEAIDYQVIRSKRKSIEISITEEAILKIRAPKFVSERQIIKFLDKQEFWIKRNIAKQQKRLAMLPQRNYCNGDLFYYLGESYSLELVETQPSSLIFDNGFYLEMPKQSQGEKIFTAWYRNRAQENFKERIEIWEREMQLFCKSWKLSNPQTLWGSCSGENVIRLNWRLIMAPQAIIDYVIIHELAHIEHKHHQAEFWDLVEIYCPNYRVCRNWLKEKGHLLKM